ncbi:MAG: hypothetical protein DRI65_11930 [Chloroflexota bacterium]|nr:MAG: hypothetical protein DRI65_11930 [Chloroflexota bacterium]
MANTTLQHDGIYHLSEIHRPKVTRAEAVYQHLTQLLLDGKLSEGDELPSEAELARTFEVSKPIVREALRKLEVMSIIKIRHGKPPIVSPIDGKPLQLYLQLALTSMESGLTESIELRRVLECHAASLAALNATPEDFEYLNSLIEELTAHQDNTDKWVELDLAFHHEIARLSGNQLLKFMIEALGKIMGNVMRSLHHRTDLRDPAATIERHRRVYQAIAANDPDAARTEMNNHFDASLPVAHAIAGNGDDTT